MNAVLHSRVLVLNRSWAAVGVADVRRALALLFLRGARVVDPSDYSTYDFDAWVRLGDERRNGPRIRAPGFEIPVPEIIVLSAFNRRPDNEIHFSRRSIFERDENRCQYCGKRFERRRLTLDHVRPKHLGGESTWENVVVACMRCNSQKGGCLPDEASMQLIRRPVRPPWATRIGLLIGPTPPPTWHRFVSFFPQKSGEQEPENLHKPQANHKGRRRKPA